MVDIFKSGDPWKDAKMQLRQSEAKTLAGDPFEQARMRMEPQAEPIDPMSREFREWGQKEAPALRTQEKDIQPVEPKQPTRPPPKIAIETPLEPTMPEAQLKYEAPPSAKRGEMPDPQFSWRAGEATIGDAVKRGCKNVAINFMNFSRGGAMMFAELADPGGAIEQLPEETQQKIKKAQKQEPGAIKFTADELRQFARNIKQNIRDNATPQNLPYGEGAEKYVKQVAEIGPQVLIQILATMVGGYPAGFGAIGTQIAGQTYGELRKQKVDPVKASIASITNAAAQGALEQVGIARTLAKTPFGKGAKRAIADLVSKFGVEWFTEFSQAFPDKVSKMWAKSESSDDFVKKLNEVDWSKVAKQGAKEGFLTMPYAGLGAFQIDYGQALPSEAKGPQGVGLLERDLDAMMAGERGPAKAAPPAAPEGGAPQRAAPEEGPPEAAPAPEGRDPFEQALMTRFEGALRPEQRPAGAKGLPAPEEEAPAEPGALPAPAERPAETPAEAQDPFKAVTRRMKQQPPEQEAEGMPTEPKAIEKEAEAKAKEPWQMTREEYAKQSGKKVSGQSVPKTEKLARLFHLDQLKLAIKEGKPVSAIAFQDYPQNQYPKLYQIARQAAKEGKPVPDEIFAEYAEAAPEETPAKFSPGDTVYIRWEATGKDEPVNFRGYEGDQAVVVKDGQQMMVPVEDLKATPEAAPEAAPTEPPSAKQPGEPEEMPDKYWPGDSVTFLTPGGTPREGKVEPSPPGSDLYEIKEIESGNKQAVEPSRITELIEGGRNREQAKKWYQKVEKGRRESEKTKQREQRIQEVTEELRDHMGLDEGQFQVKIDEWLHNKGVKPPQKVYGLKSGKPISGNTKVTAAHKKRAQKLADETGSPVVMAQRLNHQGIPEGTFYVELPQHWGNANTPASFQSTVLEHYFSVGKTLETGDKIEAIGNVVFPETETMTEEKIKAGPEADVTPKQQKDYLFREINKALQKAPRRANGTSVEYGDQTVEHGTVKIEIPGDGEFEILNTQEALNKFHKMAESFPAAVPPKYEPQATETKPKPTNERIPGDQETQYYNEFAPRKHNKAVMVKNRPPQWDGEFFTNSSYMVKLNGKPEVPEARQDEYLTGDQVEHDFGGVLKTQWNEAYSSATLMGELAGPDVDTPPQVHARSDQNLTEDRSLDFFYDAYMVDHILTAHPNAKPYMTNEGTLIFGKGDQPVGAVAPMDAGANPLTDYQARRMQQIHGDTSITSGTVHTKQTGRPGGKASEAKFARDADFKSRYAGPESSYDTGEYGAGGDMAKAMDMPFIVQLAERLMQGDIPRVKRMLAKRDAAGVFKPTGEGRIELHYSIFTSPEQARKVLAHEIGHLDDWLPGKISDRGNLLNSIAKLKDYMHQTILLDPRGPPTSLTRVEKERLKEEAQNLARVEAEELIDEKIEENLPITPDDILAIWNTVNPEEAISKDMTDYVKTLSAAEKKSIVKEALSGRTPAELEQFSRTVLRPTGRQVKSINQEKYQKEFSKIYRKLINEELKKRKYIQDSTVVDELKAFTQLWKPFDPDAVSSRYRRYRFSNEELYADALSALITNPAILKENAPTFYKAFFNYMPRHTPFNEAWKNLQEEMNRSADDLAWERRQDLQRGFMRGHELRRKRIRQAKAKMKHPFEPLLKWFDDKNSIILNRAIRGIERERDSQGNLTERAKKSIALRNYLQQMENFSTVAQVYTSDLQQKLFQRLREKGINITDLDYYLFQNRVIGERFDIANPRGNYKELSEKDLSITMGQWGPEKSKYIQEIAQDFRDIRENVVLPILRESGLISETLMDHIENTKDYATFDPLGDFEQRYGRDITSKIYRQYGTLRHVGSLTEATIIKDIKLMRSAMMNRLKQQLEEVALDPDIDLLSPADMYYSQDFKKQMPRNPKSKEEKIFTVVHNGQARHYYAPKEMVEALESETTSANFVATAARWFGRLPREVFVGKNPIFMIRNLPRDYFTTVKNIEEVKLRSMPRLLKYYKDALPETARYVFKGMLSPDIREMAKQGAFPKSRMWSYQEPTISGEITEMVEEIMSEVDKTREGLNEFSEESARKYPMAVKYLKKVWNGADMAASTTEIISKVAAYKYLKNHSNKSSQQIAIDVRDKAGTPNIKSRGTLNTYTNNFFPFSTVNMSGMKASYASYRDNPRRYFWKTMAFNFGPSMVRWGLRAGTVLKLMEWMLNEEDEPEEELAKKQQGQARDEISNTIGWTKYYSKLYRGILQYDMENYNCVALYETERGKTAYLRIPQDYEGQYLSKIASIIMQGKFTGPDGLVSAIAEHSPYDLNPFLKEPWNWYQYFGLGINPVDKWYGEQILSRQEAKAGGKYAAGRLAKHSWKNLGGDILFEPAWNKVTENRTQWQDFLTSFPGNILGTFLKYSDRGYMEEYYERIEESQKQQAIESLEQRNAYIKLANGKVESFDDILPILLDEQHTRRKKIMELLGKQYGDAFTEMITQANNRRELNIALQIMLEQAAVKKPNK